MTTTTDVYSHGCQRFHEPQPEGFRALNQHVCVLPQNDSLLQHKHAYIADDFGYRVTTYYCKTAKSAFIHNFQLTTSAKMAANALAKILFLTGRLCLGSDDFGLDFTGLLRFTNLRKKDINISRINVEFVTSNFKILKILEFLRWPVRRRRRV